MTAPAIEAPALSREAALSAAESWLRAQGIRPRARNWTANGTRLDFIARVRCGECGCGTVTAGYSVTAAGAPAPDRAALRKALVAWSAAMEMVPDRHRVAVLAVSPDGSVAEVPAPDPALSADYPIGA